MTKVSKLNLASRDFICEALKKQIQQGFLKPGQELVQEKLAQAFGVSRMPIREALQILVLEGFVERLDNRHMQVALIQDDKNRPMTKNVMTESVTLKKAPLAKKSSQAWPEEVIGAGEQKEDAPVVSEEAASLQISRINLLPAREQVAAVLRKAILSQELQAGQEITLEGMANQVGVSITPVREAFQILAGDGLIRLRPNKGALVLGVNAKTIQDHYETRSILESEAAAKAAAKGVDISRIEEVYKKSLQSLAEKRYQDYKQYNQSWHLAIWRAAGNRKMEMLLSSLWNGLSMGYNVTEEEYAQISMKEHTKIMEAIRKRDPKLAKKMMRAHIQRSLENILTHLKEAASS